MFLSDYPSPHRAHLLTSDFRHRGPATYPQPPVLPTAHCTERERPLLLIVPSPALRAQLAHLLQANGYLIYAVSDIDAAFALLTIQAVALIVLHSSTQPSAEELQTYVTLRRHTNRPTIMLPVAAADFDDDHAPAGQTQANINLYLQTIALLWRVFVSA